MSTDILTLLDRLASLLDDQAVLRQAQEDALTPKLRAELVRIATRFSDKMAHLDNELELQTLLVRTAVLELGASVKGERLHAVYAAGRPTWNDDKLLGFAASQPALLTLRTVGKASVRIQKVSPDA
jgi:hypothetical protein